MIISDLNYLEVATEANNLEGGADWSLTITGYQMELAELNSASTSGVGGSTVVSVGRHINTSSFGLNAIYLG